MEGLAHIFSVCFAFIADYFKKNYFINFRNLSSGQSLATVHGAVLALVASVLSAPYDMPGYVYSFLTYSFFCFFSP